MYEKNKAPASAEAMPLLSQKPTNCNFFYAWQKYATTCCKAVAISVSVATTISSPHTISGPVYILQLAYEMLEHTSVGHATGVGHGAGVVRKLSSHPQFAHLFNVLIS
jgi:hypothetical protein